MSNTVKIGISAMWRYISFYFQNILKWGVGIQFSEPDKLPGKEMKLSIFNLWQKIQKQLIEQACLIGLFIYFSC